jgi:predicted nuclease of predicted toxin-antitoxin system
MRVLLDENLPRKLRLLIAAHEVRTAAFQGWSGLANGALLAAAEADGFDVMVTADQNMEYQQNLKGRKLALVVLSNNGRSIITEKIGMITAAIDASAPGDFRFLQLTPPG